MVKIMGKIKPKTFAGPVEISTRILKFLKIEFAPILTKLVNASTRTEKFPKELKLGKIKPIYKGEWAKYEATDYGPINLLSCMGKLIEKVEGHQLMKYLERNEILSSQQHISRAG